MKAAVWIVGMFLTFAAVGASVTEAWASCPPGTRYACYPAGNGKMACGCY